MLQWDPELIRYALPKAMAETTVTVPEHIGILALQAEALHQIMLRDSILLEKLS